MELLHAARRVDEENDVLAVDGNAADLVLVDRRPIVGEQAPHLLGQGLPRRREAVLLGLERGILDGEHLRPDALETRLQVLGGHLVDAHALGRRHFVAAHAIGLAEYFVELLLVLDDQAVEIALGLLEPAGLAYANQQKEQDHGAESAADRVEERHAEDLELAAASHGQSSEGAIIEPPVRIARSQ